MPTEQDTHLRERHLARISHHSERCHRLFLHVALYFHNNVHFAAADAFTVFWMQHLQ